MNQKPSKTPSMRNSIDRSSLRPGLLLTALTLACVALSPAVGTGTTPGGPLLFVTTTLSNAVAVIDSATNEVTTIIPVGISPIRLAMTPDGLKAYVSNNGDQTVSVIDTVHQVVKTTITTLYPGPQELTVTPDGGRVFVVHQYSGYVSVIDTAQDMLITNVAIPGNEAKDVLATPDGRFVYVANYSAGMVNVIDTSTYQVNNLVTAGGLAGLQSRQMAVAFMLPTIWEIRSP